jgi:hypothetical protein
MSKINPNNITDVLVEELIEEDENTIISRSETEILDKNDSGRDHRGRFLKGNKISKGRPKSEDTIVTKFRDNPKNFDLINNMVEIASTLGQKNQHKDAMACAKLVVERLVPALKSSELKLGSSDDTGVVILPPQLEPDSE